MNMNAPMVAASTALLCLSLAFSAPASGESDETASEERARPGIVEIPRPVDRSRRAELDFPAPRAPQRIFADIDAIAEAARPSFADLRAEMARRYAGTGVAARARVRRRCTTSSS